MLKKLLIAGLEILILVLLIVSMVFIVEGVSIGEELYSEAYVICQPNDFVNVRERPSSRSEVVGRYETGDKVFLDGREKGGFSHIVHTGLETEDAWICTAYLVDDKPEWLNQSATVVSKGRLAARKNIDGKRRCWLRNGDGIKVYWFSNEWCVTDKGFVRTDFIDLDGE